MKYAPARPLPARGTGKANLSVPKVERLLTSIPGIPGEADVPLGIRVVAYRNLNKGAWSVKSLDTVPHLKLKAGIVIARVLTIYLSQAVFKVSETGRQRVIRNKCKEVHAGIEGVVVAVNGPPPPGSENWIRVTYDPYKAPTFVEAENRDRTVGSAAQVYFNTAMKVLADRPVPIRTPMAPQAGPVKARTEKLPVEKALARWLEPTASTTVDARKVEAHVLRYNPHTGPRDARTALASEDLTQYDWQGPAAIDPNDPRLSDVYAASKRDVAKYAKHPGPLPAVVLLDHGWKWAVLDGAHRIEAARARRSNVLAYIGTPKQPSDPMEVSRVELLPAPKVPKNQATLAEIQKWDRAADDFIAFIKASPRSGLSYCPFDSNDLKNWGQRHKLHVEGFGARRAVFDLNDEVIKFDPDPGDPDGNQSEIRVWEQAPEHLRPLLMPLRAWDPKGRWLIMEKAAFIGGFLSYEAMESLKQCGISDYVADYNLSDDGRIIDYANLDKKKWVHCAEKHVERLASTPNRSFTRTLQQALVSPEAKKLLKVHFPAVVHQHATPWMHGGCLTLAVAVQEALGSDATLVSVYLSPADRNPKVLHVAVYMDGCYYDGEGCHLSVQDFLNALEPKVGRAIDLRPYDPKEAASCHIPLRRTVVKGLVPLLAGSASKGGRTTG